MTVTATQPYGGFAITGYRAHGGEETVAFTATLTRYGKPVASVRNDGCGGCNLFTFQDRDASDAWRALAHETFRGEFEPEDHLFGRLHLVAILNRARTVAFVVDGMDPFVDGRYRSYRKDVTFEEALRHLTGPGFASLNPKVWVKTRSEFVPATDLVDA